MSEAQLRPTDEPHSDEHFDRKVTDMSVSRSKTVGGGFDVGHGVQPITYRFGPYMLDTNRRVLYSGLRARALTEKTFQVLLLLLESNGKMVRKETFFSHVWRHGNVSEANLTQQIFMLRQLLGERGGQNEYIITVAGEGYRFACPLESKLGLALKSSCERCSRPLESDAVAMICSYECTFCPECARSMRFFCPNCGGELIPRPRRLARASRKG